MLACASSSVSCQLSDVRARICLRSDAFWSGTRPRVQAQRRAFARRLPSRLGLDLCGDLFMTSAGLPDWRSWMVGAAPAARSPTTRVMARIDDEPSRSPLREHGQVILRIPARVV